ncbi:hypothetical protein Q1695_000386 [Nippostrongylus brasiliensis]|nr:hypothetical protein Q1695_000386 [Nippostrongylus brasiliensis]
MIHYGRQLNAEDVRIDLESHEDPTRSQGSTSDGSNGSLHEADRATNEGRRASSRSVLEAAGRLRGEYARLQEAINQNQEEAQSLWTLAITVIPFIFLFSLKVIFDNFLAIFRILLAIVGFVIIDSRVQQLYSAAHPSASARISAVVVFVVLFFLSSGLYIYDNGFDIRSALLLSAHPSASARISAVVVFVVLFFLSSGLYIYDNGFDIRSALLLQYAGIVYHGFYFTLYVLVLTDTLIKMAVSGLKLVVSLVGTNMGMKRKITQLLEYLSQMYRCIVPAPQWVHYFSGPDDASFMIGTNGVLLSIYACIKARELWIISQMAIDCASRMLCPTPYGVNPTNDELVSQGMCSVCHGSFSSPVKLNCSHIFCSTCIDTWLECENTCPMCRAIVEKKNNAWKNGATSKLIRLC